jgi:hypothetical protein
MRLCVGLLLLVVVVVEPRLHMLPGVHVPLKGVQRRHRHTRWGSAHRRRRRTQGADVGAGTVHHSGDSRPVAIAAASAAAVVRGRGRLPPASVAKPGWGAGGGGATAPAGGPGGGRGDGNSRGGLVPLRPRQHPPTQSHAGTRTRGAETAATAGTAAASAVADSANTATQSPQRNPRNAIPATQSQQRNRSNAVTPTQSQQRDPSNAIAATHHIREGADGGRLGDSALTPPWALRRRGCRHRVLPPLSPQRRLIVVAAVAVRGFPTAA